MPKPTAQAMRAARAIWDECWKHDLVAVSAVIDRETRLPALIETLRFYADKGTYIADTNQADPVPQVFPPEIERDQGERARAALQDAEGSSDATNNSG